MKKIKIGILTHYYHSRNYGGMLQAYALSEFCNSFDRCECEQICFDPRIKYSFKEKLIVNIAAGSSHFFNATKKFLNKKFMKFLHGFSLVWVKNKHHLQERDEVIDDFKQNLIRHSSGVYNNNSIVDIANYYDVYISGSDQVWLRQDNSLNNAYWLGFVDSEKIKITYAASPVLDFLTSSEQDYVVNALIDHDIVSVREKSGIVVLKAIFKRQCLDKSINPIYVVDPVFLFPKSYWSSIAKDTDITASKYVFSYLLGDSLEQRDAISSFCDEIKMILCTLPFAKDEVHKCDFDFGSKQFYDISPLDFIGLIKNADFVVTDSFHALAFSIIFNKKCCVVERVDNDEKFSSARITDLLDLIDKQDIYLEDSMVSAESIMSIYSDNSALTSSASLNKLIGFSKDILKSAIFT